MKYRKAEKTDVQLLAKLFDAYRVFYRKETDLIGASQFILERLTNKDSEIFVAQSDKDEMLGFVQLYPLFSSTKMRRLWLLNDLFVSPLARGKGISKGLISQAKELVVATNACGILLETEKSNHIGNKLYPKTGFQLNEASNYYEWNNV